MKDYAEHFDVRGSSYDQAMRLFPRARDQEFLQVVSRANLKPEMIVADVPAGGGYLKDYLPSGCVWQGHEPCSSFLGYEHHRSLPLLPLPWQDQSIDVAISLAGVHHIDDKIELFSELKRVVKANGRLILSDVATGSAVAMFLNGFVGSHNSTGHDAVFLDENTLQELKLAGWKISSCEMVDIDWLFPTRNAMAEFCHKLFDLCHGTVEETERAIVDQLGVTERDASVVAMKWSLLTIVAQA